MNFRKRAIGGWLKNNFRPFGQIVPKVKIARFARFFPNPLFYSPNLQVRQSEGVSRYLLSL